MKKHAGVQAGREKTALFLFCCSSLSASGKQGEDEATAKSEVSGVKKMEIIPNLPSKIFIDLRDFSPTPYGQQIYSFLSLFLFLQL